MSNKTSATAIIEEMNKKAWARIEPDGSSTINYSRFDDPPIPIATEDGHTIWQWPDGSKRKSFEKLKNKPHPISYPVGATQAGRPAYVFSDLEEDPETGEKTHPTRSEYTATEFIPDESGPMQEQIGKRGYWVNFPTIFPTASGVRMLEPHEAFEIMLQNGGTDPETGETWTKFRTMDEAIDAAIDRTGQLKARFGNKLKKKRDD